MTHGAGLTRVLDFKNSLSLSMLNILGHLCLQVGFECKRLATSQALGLKYASKRQIIGPSELWSDRDYFTGFPIALQLMPGELNGSVLSLTMKKTR